MRNLPRYGMPLLACCLVVFLSGCAPRLFPLPDESARIHDPATLAERIAVRQSHIRTISTTGRIDSRSPAGPLRGRITTLVSSDGKVRFDAWTPTWDLVGSFVGDYETFVYFERGQKNCLFGNSTFETINKVLPLGLDFQQYVHALMGTPKILADAKWTIDFDRRIGCWSMTGSDATGKTQTIWADSDGTVRRARWKHDRKTTMEVIFSSLRTIDVDGEKIRFPSEISFSVPDKKSRATIKFRDIDINDETEDGDWEQICPEGLGMIFIR